MESLFLILGWPGPIGIFLVCLGVMIWLLLKADEIIKRTREIMRKRGWTRNNRSSLLPVIVRQQGLDSNPRPSGSRPNVEMP